MTVHDDPLARAESTAREWLATIAEALDTQDREHTYRMLRAWLHVVRDRLTVDSAAHLAAQLPEFLRGVYYEGWVPSRVPVRYDTTGFFELFTCESGVTHAEAPAIAAAITSTLDKLFSPGQLDHVLAVLPTRLRAELMGESPAPGVEDHRLRDLEKSVTTLTDAVKTLARGLEELPTGQPAGKPVAQAAQEAHRLLLAAETTAGHD
ncbi:DUF2267 domain-containing protein [Amycolatopsis sp. NPDC059657]|uniref:DUF2267 domain-containing protein n=1 Tax=Amycolatopsis sp. NPDC059657 TaxID=3346899 RepID=UPI003670A6EE